MSGSVRFLLNPASLFARVPQATGELGKSIYLQQKVIDCRLYPANAQEWQIDGEVHGSHREEYEVSVALETSPAGDIILFNGSCTCPVGRNCKHTVALTLKAAYKSGTVRPAAPPAAVQDPAELLARQQAQAREREQRQASEKVKVWLDLFGDAADAGQGDGHDTPDDDAGTPADEERCVYLLVPGKDGALPALQLGAGITRRLRNGKWGKARPLRHGDNHRASATDQEIQRLIGSMGTSGYSYNYNNTGLRSVVAGQAGLLALQMAAAADKLFSTTEDDDRALDRALRWGPARSLAWSWNEVSTLNMTEPLWALRPRMADADAGADAGAGHARWFANRPPLYLDAEAGLCGPLEMPGLSTEHLLLLLKAPPIPQSAFATHEATLLRHLAGLPLPPVLKAPELVQGVVPVARLHIGRVPAQDAAALGLLRATLRFDYAGVLHYQHGTASPVLIEQDGPPAHTAGAGTPSAASPAKPTPATRRVLLHRDLAAEQAAHQRLQALGLAGSAAGRFHLLARAGERHQTWLRWADEDFATLREAGFALDMDPGLAGWIQRADALKVHLAPRDGEAGADGSPALADEGQSPWFDLSLGMEVNGQRYNILPLLPALLAHLQPAAHDGAASPASPGGTSGTIETSDAEGGDADGSEGAAAPPPTLQLPPYVYLPQPDGTYLRLPTEPLRPWLMALLDLVGERQAGALAGDALRLSRLEALRMGAVLGEGARWSGAERLRQMVAQLAGRSALPEVAAPTGLQAQLRPYQAQGLAWLQFLRANGLAGILADDMGLGKTLQTLAHVLTEKQAGRLDRPVLVIAPVSLMGNWRREAARFAPELSTLVLHGSQRHEAATGMARHDLVIAPYSLLQRDRERWLAQPWHLVVLDEAQNIKNANTHAAQIVGELDARHRLCLSGTPMENHLGELWSLFHFLMPGFLGSQQRFKELFRNPIEKHGDSERLDQLRRRVTPFMLRRTKREVATDLPDKQESIASVELEDKQANLYETIRLSTEAAVREALADKGLAKSQIQILDALLKLRQVCCDPRLVPVAAAKKIRQSAKLALLMEMLPEMLAEGRRVLLFSQFTSMLELIEEELRARGLRWVKLTGQSQKRDALIERFTSGEVPLFLISLKAGGTGLNLPQADTVIHYDPWWNPAVENQATDRAHRIGQTQRVLVYKLVAQGTIEERILALQERKAGLANSLYSESAARKQPLFTESDLAELLKPLGV